MLASRLAGAFKLANVCEHDQKSSNATRLVQTLRALPKFLQYSVLLVLASDPALARKIVNIREYNWKPVVNFV